MPSNAAMKEIFYVVSLLGSMVAGGLSVLLGLAALWISRREAVPRTARPSVWPAVRLLKVATGLAAIGGVVGLMSFFSHWLWDHGTGTVAPMTVVELVRAHPSFLVVGLLVIAGAVLAVVTRAR